MVSYRYTAEDPRGERVDGHIDAASVEEARRRLEEDGFRVLEIIQADTPEHRVPPEEHLTREEAQELAENVAQLSAAELPLAPGLRAAGDESDSPRLAKMFYHLADEIDQGRSLKEVLESSRDVLPAHVAGLIQAAIQTGQLGPALTELVEQYRDASALRQTIRDGLSYPLLVAGLAVAVLGFILAYVAGGFEQIYDEFGMELPALTKAIFLLRHSGGWLLALLAALLLIGLVVRSRMEVSERHRLLASTPVVGPLWHWLCLLEWFGSLRVLIRNGMTLLDALRLSAEGAPNANIHRLSNSLADGIARGRPLSQMMASERQMPASLVPLVRWGETTGDLAESLEMGCEMLEDRVRMRSFWLHTALPPILFIAVACAIVFVFSALFLPMIKLISNLS
jgi:type II secretory pathway component PulF